MAYDPLKALQAAGVLPATLPAGIEQAIAGLSQSEVDIIVSQSKSFVSPAGTASLPWMNPAMMPMSGAVTMGCFCGIWSGSGSGGGAV